ncbi:hypothetical protein K491DRAFT_274067 [Lophiostoma macrostomum CBS 122681]|uniref:Uncharacterized protein n=1 Tax=Lophiostoma macrostomum CBS 122681 TaxID=1314788 RepID=A0A6A6TEV7_9PLEO|nr:hypothetical protein K491DRAFT_274067 [Lophiostoma macrostomum CBS 122681]
MPITQRKKWTRRPVQSPESEKSSIEMRHIESVEDRLEDRGEETRAVRVPGTRHRVRSPLPPPQEPPRRPSFPQQPIHILSCARQFLDRSSPPSDSESPNVMGRTQNTSSGRCNMSTEMKALAETHYTALLEENRPLQAESVCMDRKAQKTTCQWTQASPCMYPCFFASRLETVSHRRGCLRGARIY